MPIDADFLSKLRCPRTHRPMRLLATDGLAALNAAIAAGGVRALGGRLVEEPLTEALQPDGEAFVYPIEDGIPILLKDDAVPLPGASAGDAPAGS